MKFLSKTLCVFALAATAVAVPFSAAMAQVNVNGIIRTILPDQRPIENVTVTNYSDDRILQVDIEVMQAVRQKDGSEVQKPTDDFLVAPKTMILRPQEQKQARLVLRQPPGEEERYYRVKFKARLPDPIRMKALELTKAEQEAQDEIRGGIMMVSGVGMFITVAPKNPQPKLTWERTGEGVLFKNTGNTTIEMRPRKEYCYDGNQCVELLQKRIFPGEEWLFAFPADEPLVYYYKTYKKTHKAIIGTAD